MIGGKVSLSSFITDHTRDPHPHRAAHTSHNINNSSRFLPRVVYCVAVRTLGHLTENTHRISKHSPRQAPNPRCPYPPPSPAANLAAATISKQRTALAIRCDPTCRPR